MEITRKRPTVPRLRGLPATRTGALVLALVCAILAAGLIAYAIGQYRTSVSASARQDLVLVATGLIQKGTSGGAIAAEQLFKPTSVLEKHLSTGAIHDATLLRGKAAVRDILPGQQLTLADFVIAGGITAQLARNQRAVSVSLDTSHGLLDVLQNGDRVDVYGGFSVANNNGPSVPVTRLLIPGAVVLKAPGSGGSTGLSGSTQGATVLLAVNDSQAPTLAFAADNGKIWLMLRPGDAANPNQSLTSLDSVVFGVQPKLTSSSGGLAPSTTTAPAGTTTTTTGSHR